MKRFTLKCALCGIFATLAIVSFVIENLFPPIIFVGARIGVSNIFILIALFILGSGYAFTVLALKTLLGSLFAGNLSMIMYSLPAGVISLGCEILLILFIKRLSLVSISAFGAVVNTIVQTLIFCLVTGTSEYLFYLPYLALIALLAGLTVGLAVTIIIKRLPKNLFMENGATQSTTSDKRDTKTN